MKTFDYHSPLATEMRRFVVFKQRQGFDYVARAERLRKFDNFLIESGFAGAILDESIVSGYIARLAPYAPNTRLNCFSVVKEFAAYLAMFNSTSYVIRKTPFRKPSCGRAYIFTRDEVDSLLREALARRSCSQRQSLSDYMIIGLLAYTGLRIQECLNLNIGSWNEEAAEIFVKRGKFEKDRIIPVSLSVKEKMTFFIQRRKELSGFHRDAPLFVGRGGARRLTRCFREVFSELLDTCGIDRKPHASRPPTLHSLRHTFAVNNIIKWTRQGKNVNAMLPYLSRYMGHVNVTSTQVYLQCVEELRSEGARKFHSLFAKCAVDTKFNGEQQS